mmetsp:Transcript_39443/g.41052  ORF Transcript_39443/g.41052 Transcript_39443/m.41052 type:complete len:80 (-) Transcript_39443:70-309(-)
MILFLPLVRFESVLDHSEFENKVVVDYSKADLIIENQYINSYYILNDINEEYETPGIFQGLVTDDFEAADTDNKPFDYL